MTKKRWVILLGSLLLAVCVVGAGILLTPKVTAREVIVDGLLPEYTPQQMMEYASLVAEGEIVSASEPFTVCSDDGATANYVDYQFKLSQVFRGEAENGSVSVRVPGGKVDDFRYTVLSAAPLACGESYILFLYRPHMGGDTLTEGDYYLVLGDWQGAYRWSDKAVQNAAAEEAVYVSTGPAKAEASVSSDNLRTAAKEGGITKDVISVPDFSRTMEAFNQTVPVNEYWFRDETLDNLRYNLETGFISQEEYDLYLSRMEKYGRIVS